MNVVSPTEGLAKVKQGALLIDVREPNEFEEVRATQAMNIPLGELLDRLGELPKDADLVMICRSGRRSATAAEQLLERGYQQVANLTGGTIAWVSDGLPTEGTHPEGNTL